MKDFLEAINIYPWTSFFLGLFILCLIAVFRNDEKN